MEPIREYFFGSPLHLVYRIHQSLKWCVNDNFCVPDLTVTWINSPVENIEDELENEKD